MKKMGIAAMALTRARLAACCVVAAAGAGALVPLPAVADHRVVPVQLEVSGEQTTVWEFDETYVDPCGGATVHSFGSGRERFSFGTNQPVSASLVHVNATYWRFRIGSDNPGDSFGAVLVLDAQTLRNGFEETTVTGGTPCADGCSEEDCELLVPLPDCGLRRHRLFVDLYVALKNTLGLNTYRPFWNQDIFRNCPIRGVHALDLLDAFAPQRSFLAAGYDEDDPVQKRIVWAKDRKTEPLDGGASVTEIDWKVAITADTSPPGLQRDATGDRIPPTLVRAALSPSAFLAKRATDRGSVRAGTSVRLALSEPATVRFRVERAVRGPALSRYSRLRGGFTRSATTGLNRFRWFGRLAGRALPPGRYALVGVATDAAGNQSPPHRVPFRIRR